VGVVKKPAKKKSYTITEAANKLGITRAAVHEAIRKKKIRASWGNVKVEMTVRALLIPADDLKRYRVDVSRQERGKKTKLA
jgi:excisionase family DNA binding protein